MAWYKTGTVSVTNNSATVTGSGTNFVSGAQVGFGFKGPNGVVYEITAINSFNIINSNTCLWRVYSVGAVVCYCPDPRSNCRFGLRCHRPDY